MKNYMYEKLKNHIGHDIVCVAYGDINNPDDICIECEDCNEVLISAETYEEEQQENSQEETNTIKNLIKAMCNYAMEFSWTDSETIDALIECGITKQDFIDCGYEDFVEEYFEKDEEKNDADDEISHRWDEAWEKEVERRLKD
jgi:hypothetical protein